jgi:hypothetical protein
MGADVNVSKQHATSIFRTEQSMVEKRNVWSRRGGRTCPRTNFQEDMRNVEP